jgi:hypothetical protein
VLPLRSTAPVTLPNTARDMPVRPWLAITTSRLSQPLPDHAPQACQRIGTHPQPRILVHELGGD